MASDLGLRKGKASPQRCPQRRPREGAEAAASTSPRAGRQARCSADRAAGNPGHGPGARIPVPSQTWTPRLREAARGARGCTPGRGGRGPTLGPLPPPRTPLPRRAGAAGGFASQRAGGGGGTGGRGSGDSSEQGQGWVTGEPNTPAPHTPCALAPELARGRQGASLGPQSWLRGLGSHAGPCLTEWGTLWP